MKRRLRHLLLGTLVVVSGMSLISSSRAETPAPSVDFNQDVQPILAKRCFACHGPAEHEGGVALHLRKMATAAADSDMPAIVPGKPEESQLIARITSHDESARMPPEGEPLSKEEVDILRRWIASGADYALHWSFVKPTLTEVPEVKSPVNAPHAIDRFVVAKLESKGIQPSQSAPKETQLRRLYLDLVGLLPPVEKLEAFLNNESENAYEKVVDELLASQHFGERWGRHWLDLARYADTFGYERDDVRPNAWRYRDWVVNSFNANQPFDQFVTEQLAGDLLEKPTTEQLIATGLHRINIKNMEAGINKEDYRNREMIDRLNTTGTALLGLTIGCCQCHSHKYDPISQKEYYQLYAFFNNVVEKDIDIDGTPAEQAAYQNSLANYEKKKTRLQTRSSVLKGLLAAKTPAKWRQKVDKENARNERIAAYMTHLASDSTVDNWTEQLVEADTETAFGVKSMGLSKDVLAAWKVEPTERTEKQKAALNKCFESLPQTAKSFHDKVQSSEKRLLALKIDEELRSQLLISNASDVSKSKDLMSFWNSIQTRIDETNKAMRQQSVERRHLPKPQIMTLAEAKKDRRETFVLARGDFKQKTEIVFSRTPEVLPSIKAWREDPNRLDLAHWIVNAENPLTARVAVNHIWSHLFGEGIVSTLDDFGTQGSPPSHPELLDWLAVKFVELGWDRKQLIKTIVMSATYRQSSAHRAELLKVDPQNRLLARQGRFRVESEVVRDLFLDASGLLCRTMGGPTIHPEAPAAIKDLGYKYKTRWVLSSKPERYRRGLYIHFKRTNPYPSLMVFDNPEGNLCIAQRNRSNTPLQSLVMLNDPVFVECAKALGRKLCQQQGDHVSVLQQTAQKCLSRNWQPSEQQVLSDFYETELAYYLEHDKDAQRLIADFEVEGIAPAKVAAWTAVARAILNLDEFYTRE